MLPEFGALAAVAPHGYVAGRVAGGVIIQHLGHHAKVCSAFAQQKKPALPCTTRCLCWYMPLVYLSIHVGQLLLHSAPFPQPARVNCTFYACFIGCGYMWPAAEMHATAATWCHMKVEG